MKEGVSKILLPVAFDPAHLTVAKQAAEFARSRGADLYLLQVEPAVFSFQKLLHPKSYRKRQEQSARYRLSQLNAWRELLEANYPVKVHVDIERGAYQNTVLSYAREKGIDIIILKKEPHRGKKHFFDTGSSSDIIDHFAGQVITVVGDKQALAGWREIVIAVTDFIPETRIRMAIDLSRQFRVKIHLVTATSQTVTRTRPEFYFLTESLKRLKTSGKNILVECRCLANSGNRLDCYLAYCKEIKADILMTNFPAETPDPANISSRLIAIHKFHPIL